ncbi:hypothetical protein [uncultured Winogradskyella sp.]|uniref:hypothetical protein n=1 Tax=uncultured Winogradskyella sp. TaxID=395353 RepID=UPI00260782AB|nr:hypothetical protein [uncultured Winogradskyella sp.]
MKNQKILIQLLVILALLGFLACSGYLFYLSFEILVDGKLPDNYREELNSALTYVTSGLTGLVGGIVASGFGVKPPDSGNEVEESSVKTFAYKLQNLGSYSISDNKPNESKEKMGFFYALAYIVVGIGSIALWIILNENAMESISNMATTFFGMLIPIVAQYFNRS